MPKLQNKFLLQSAEKILLANGFSKRQCAKVLRASYTTLWRKRKETTK